MRKVSDLTHEELAHFVQGVLLLLYGVEGDDGSVRMERDKEVNGGDFIQDVSWELDALGLTPNQR